MGRDDQFWTWPRAREIEGGTLRLLSAWELLEARREGKELARDGGEEALCANACLLSRALERGGKPLYSSGRAVLEALRGEDIGRLAGEWARFNRECNPSPAGDREELERAKKAWSTRLMSAFAGACSACSALFPRRRGPGG